MIFPWNPLPILRVPVLLLLSGVLAGCATSEIRGQFSYDVRPINERTDLIWPKPPDQARYRYAGELIGQQNFTQISDGTSTAKKALQWLVGLLDDDAPVSLQRPQHGMVGEEGQIYVVDASRNAVLVFDPKPPPDTKSDKEGGQLLEWSDIGNNMRLGSPAAISQAWGGDVAVSDAKYGVVFRLNKQGQFVAAIGEGQLRRPTGIAFDRQRGLLFVADTAANDIKVFDAAAQHVNTISKAGETLLNAPTLLTAAGDRLYVADTLNSQIHVFDFDGNYLRSFGQRGLFVGNLTRPKGVAVGGDGIVYVIESYYGHLLAFDQDAQFLIGINGNGMKDDRFYLPSGVWTDGADKIYVADMFNGRVVVFQYIGSKHQ